MVKRELSPDAISTDTSGSPPGSEYTPSAGDRDVKDDFEGNPAPSTPKQKKSSGGTGNRSASSSPKKPRTSPSKTPSGMASAPSATTVRGHFAELIIEAGIQAVKKDLVESQVSSSPSFTLGARNRLSPRVSQPVIETSLTPSQTGLNPRQQHEMTRKDGKGSLRKALMAFAASL